MKILHVIPSVSERSGGPGQAILPMCLALREAGVEVLLATTNSGVTGSQQPPSYKDLPVNFFPHQFSRSFKYSHPFAHWLSRHVADFDAVHIHAIFNHSCIAAARACLKHKVPYVVRPLGTLSPWAMSQKGLRKRAFLRLGVLGILRGASAIHYTTTLEQKACEEWLRLDNGVVIPLGAEIPSDEYRSRLNPATAWTPYVLMLSRLLPNKGVDVLLDSFLSLLDRQEFRPWHLVLAGDGPIEFVMKLQQISAEHRNSKCVTFTGWLAGERKTEVLRNASLLALPSHHENFGLCVMESLACGVPVLISPNVNLAPEVESSQSGWISKVDKLSLEKTLTDALSSPAELQRRGKNGQLLAQNYSWTRIAEQLSALYSEIVRTKTRHLQSSRKVTRAAAGL